MANAVTSGVGPADARSKSFWPARLDWTESASGLFVALFMCGHMFFVSSILVSEHAMWTVTKMFEGYFVFGRPYPGIVSAVVAGVTAVIVLHAALALRKFPINWRQYTIGDDDGVFGCMSLLGCHDVCPKELPLETRIGFLRRKMGRMGFGQGGARGA